MQPAKESCHLSNILMLKPKIETHHQQIKINLYVCSIKYETCSTYKILGVLRFNQNLWVQDQNQNITGNWKTTTIKKQPIEGEDYLQSHPTKAPLMRDHTVQWLFHPWLCTSTNKHSLSSSCVYASVQLLLCEVVASGLLSMHYRLYVWSFYVFVHACVSMKVQSPSRWTWYNKLGSNCRPWKAIAGFFLYLNLCSQWKFENDGKTLFWTDRWINYKSLSQELPSSFGLFTFKDGLVTYFSDFSSSSLGWNPHFLNAARDVSWKKWQRAVASLLGVFTPREGGYWTLAAWETQFFLLHPF